MCQIPEDNFSNLHFIFPGVSKQCPLRPLGTIIHKFGFAVFLSLVFCGNSRFGEVGKQYFNSIFLLQSPYHTTLVSSVQYMCFSCFLVILKQILHELIFRLHLLITFWLMSAT